MKRRRFLILLTKRIGLGLSATAFTGCGTILHSERSGRPHSNQIDWKIAALDGLGLLLFFVPGVIAFAVDFYTGAIYLPLEETYPNYGAGPAYPPLGLPPAGYSPATYPPPATSPSPYQPTSYPSPGYLAPPGSEMPTAAPPSSGVPAATPAPPANSASPPPGAAALPVQSGLSDERQLAEQGVKRIVVARQDLAPAGIERIVGQHVGRPVSLDHPETRVNRLSSLDEFLSRLKLWS